jgi:ATP-dependent DNA helicase RecG
MPESQNTEWKTNWRDEYLKWIAGFANAQGGTIFIGVNDNGEVVGLSDYESLLEELPNKFRDQLGIIADIDC